MEQHKKEKIEKAILDRINKKRGFEYRNLSIYDILENSTIQEIIALLYCDELARNHHYIGTTH